MTGTGLDAVLRPRSVAVVGASPRSDSLGHRLLRSILDGGFAGPVHPVHPFAPEVLGHAAFADVRDIPEPPELAVIAVPAANVPDVARAAAQAGVKALLVVSSGFREAGPDGAAREQELLQIVRGAGMRLVGPNCVGVIESGHLDAVFAEHAIRAGGAAIMTQSGAVGLALLDMARRRGLGIASFVSLGNKADVSVNDLLERWTNEETVTQIMMYVEDFGNARNFRHIAHAAAQRKPVLVVKSGRSPAAQAAARSHTAALAEAERTVDAMLQQAGVLRFGTVQAMFDAAMVFATGRVPIGARTGIVTNSGGPAIMALDAMAALEPASLGDSTLRRLAHFIAQPSHPVDVLGQADHATFLAALDAVMDDPGVDVVLALETVVADAGLPSALAAQQWPKPLVFVRYGKEGDEQTRRLMEAGIPSYPFPEDAVRALEASWRWRSRPRREEPVPMPCPSGCTTVEGRGWLTQDDAMSVLARHGLPVPRCEGVASLGAARGAAARIGYPVVLKGGGLHKSDQGRVHLGLHDEAALNAAWSSLPEEARRGAAVMRQERRGLEILLGVVQDARFGPLVAVGLGGTRAEALQDVAFRLAPLAKEDASQMIDSLRAKVLIDGFRNEPRRDRAAVEDALQRMASLAWHHPEIAEAEANPMLLWETGGIIVDARIRIASPERV